MVITVICSRVNQFRGETGDSNQRDESAGGLPDAMGRDFRGQVLDNFGTALGHRAAPDGCVDYRSVEDFLEIAWRAASIASIGVGKRSEGLGQVFAGLGGAAGTGVCVF
jgi:hypothetical protein